MAAEADEVRVQIVGVFEQRVELRDQEQRIPLVVVRDPANRELRLPIGSCEGFAIHIALEDHIVPRPLTHDLGLRLLERLSAKLDRVVIDELADDASHATVHIQSAEGPITLDARPGDAVALALRAEAPVYVTEQILARAGQSSEDTF